MAIPQGPNQRWSLDFASNALTNGRRFRILVVADDFTGECPTLVADTSVGRLPVAHELDLQTRPLSPDRRYRLHHRPTRPARRELPCCRSWQTG
jgi:transposase InsO family protein